MANARKAVSKKHPVHKNAATSFRLSEKTRERIAKLAEKLEATQTYVMEQAIRELAERNGVEI